VEAVKAVYRLYLLFLVEARASMLIQWGRVSVRVRVIKGEGEWEGGCCGFS
jgi:hypothetical protein